MTVCLTQVQFTNYEYFLLVQVTVNFPLVRVMPVRVNINLYSYSCKCESGHISVCKNLLTILHVLTLLSVLFSMSILFRVFPCWAPYQRQKGASLQHIVYKTRRPCGTGSLVPWSTIPRVRVNGLGLVLGWGFGLGFGWGWG